MICVSALSQSAGSPRALSGRVPNVNLRLQAEPAVDLVDLAQQGLDLVLQLVGPEVDVGVVLDEVADASQAGQRARPLVAVQPAELGVAQRQVAV